MAEGVAFVSTGKRSAIVFQNGSSTRKARARSFVPATVTEISPNEPSEPSVSEKEKRSRSCARRTTVHSTAQPGASFGNETVAILPAG